MVTPQNEKGEAVSVPVRTDTEVGGKYIGGTLGTSVVGLFLICVTDKLAYFQVRIQLHSNNCGEWIVSLKYILSM